MKLTRKTSRKRNAFTMIEIMLVILIIIILAGAALPAYNGLVRLADAAHTVSGLKSITNATHRWAADHSNKLPSPLYPGGHDPAYLPENAMLVSGGEPGMWLNGVVFAATYLETDAELGSSEPLDPSINLPYPTAGDHLVGTVFESKTSIRQFSTERNWYRHSYAMNANLQYDRINEDSSDPWFTEKEVSKFDQPKAMIYVDCIEDNIVFAEDIKLLEDAAELRHKGKYVIAAFLDGNVQKIPPLKIPRGDIRSDRESSLFWRGVKDDN